MLKKKGRENNHEKKAPRVAVPCYHVNKEKALAGPRPRTPASN